MDLRIAQFAIGRDLAANLRYMCRVLDAARPGEWVVFPEGALSGYAPNDPAYLDGLDPAAIEGAISIIRSRAAAAGCRCLFGSATHEDGHWRNTVLLAAGRTEVQRYFKAELSALDRRHFQAGPMAGEVFTVGDTALGVVACRELLFPSVWARLKHHGVSVIVHLNNAIEPHDALWTHLLIARAVEQSVFVCSVNNSASPQQLPSMVVAPSGRVILQADVQTDQTLSTRIDLADAIADLTTRTDY